MTVSVLARHLEKGDHIIENNTVYEVVNVSKQQRKVFYDVKQPFTNAIKCKSILEKEFLKVQARESKSYVWVY